MRVILLVFFGFNLSCSVESAEMPLNRPPPGPFDPTKIPGYKPSLKGMGHGAPHPAPHPTLQAIGELIQKFQPLENRIESLESKLKELATNAESGVSQADNEPDDTTNNGNNRDSAAAASGSADANELLELYRLQNNNLQSRIASLEAYVYELRKETGLLAKRTTEMNEAYCDTANRPTSSQEVPAVESNLQDAAGTVFVSVSRRASYTQEDTVIPYDVLIADSSNGFDLEDGTFTVPVSGTYSVGFYGRNFDSLTTFVQVRANGVVIADAHQTIDASFGITAVVPLQQGDVLDTFLSAGGVFSNANRFVYFTAQLLAAA